MDNLGLLGGLIPPPEIARCEGIYISDAELIESFQNVSDITAVGVHGTEPVSCESTVNDIEEWESYLTIECRPDDYGKKRKVSRTDWTRQKIMECISGDVISGDTDVVPPSGRCDYCTTQWPGGVYFSQRWSITPEGHHLCRSCHILHRVIDGAGNLTITQDDKAIPPFPRGVPARLTYGASTSRKCTIANPKYDKTMDICIICKHGTVRNKFEFWKLCNHQAHPGCLRRQYREKHCMNCIICNTLPKRPDALKFLPV